MQQPFPGDAVAAIRHGLLAFFDASARDLPWRRRQREPYAIWISEIMAQQTRIDTVLPYFERWIERFPDVDTLADAPIDDVLKQWEGLGYYSRARNLHAAARVLRERHAGAIPDSYDALRALPGVGDYTAGAVASIAFGVPEPAVDGNVRRVLSRLLDEPAPSASRLRAVAAALVPADRPGDFNQALMELGARVCTPRSPRCTACPVAQHCAARAAGTQEDRPARRPKQAIPRYDVATVVLRNSDGRVLLVRRPPHGLLAGMWSFPGVEVAGEADAADAAVALAARLAGAGSAPPAGNAARPAGSVAAHAPAYLGAIEHTFSHRRERYLCFMFDVGEVGAGAADHADESVWIGRDRRAVALPRAQQRIHALAFANADADAGSEDGAGSTGLDPSATPLDASASAAIPR
jgi:A/G-specific adenine glycosylase